MHAHLAFSVQCDQVTFLVAFGPSTGTETFHSFWQAGERQLLIFDLPPAGTYRRRAMPGNESKPESKLKICSMPFCSMTVRCTASRADKRRYSRTICFARSMTVRSTART